MEGQSEVDEIIRGVNRMNEKQSRNQAIYSFFQVLDRSFFLDPQMKDFAPYDRALSIGFGQTISQPTLVAQMTMALDLDKSYRVLEIGTGSGYQTVFLAEFAGEVFSVERIKELSKQAQERLKELGYTNIQFKIGDGSEGWSEFAPYDRIIVTAGAGNVPSELLNQLKPGGKMLTPIGETGYQELTLFKKDQNSNITIESLGGVTFVEFKGKYGWQ